MSALQYFDESRKVRQGDGAQDQAQPADAEQQAVPAEGQASEVKLKHKQSNKLRIQCTQGSTMLP